MLYNSSINKESILDGSDNSPSFSNYLSQNNIDNLSNLVSVSPSNIHFSIIRPNNRNFVTDQNEFG